MECCSTNPLDDGRTWQQWEHYRQQLYFGAGLQHLLQRAQRGCGVFQSSDRREQWRLCYQTDPSGVPMIKARNDRPLRKQASPASSKTKRPYTKPSFQHEKVFETMAL